MGRDNSPEPTCFSLSPEATVTKKASDFSEQTLAKVIYKFTNKHSRGCEENNFHQSCLQEQILTLFLPSILGCSSELGIGSLKIMMPLLFIV